MDKKLIWVLFCIALLVLGSAIGYFWFLRQSVEVPYVAPGETQVTPKRMVIFEFPQTIDTYTLVMSPKNSGVNDVCDAGFCIRRMTAEYRNEKSRVVFVHTSKILSEESSFLDYVATTSKLIEIGGIQFFRTEDHELGWHPTDNKEFDLIVIQEGTMVNVPGGGERMQYVQSPSIENPVTQYLLENFPPVANMDAATK